MRTIEEITSGISIERLEEMCKAERDGKYSPIPCEVGDTINQIRYKDGVWDICSDKITKILLNKKGFTVYTAKKFYPIKSWERDVSSVDQYPYALADYYIGSPEEAKKALERNEI